MELRDYLKVIRSRMRLILVCVVVVTAVAVAFSLLQRPAYEGTALVLVTEQDPGVTILGTPQAQQSSQPGRDIVQTQVEVINSTRIAAQVIADLGLQESPASLLGRVTATANTGTNNITIQAVDPTPDGAVRLADAFAEAYVAWSRDTRGASIKAAADDVEKRRDAAQKEIAALERTATGSSSDQSRLQAARALYASLADKLEELRIAEQLVPGQGSVLATATIDPSPVSPKPVRDGAVGIALGLLLGLGGAFVAEQLDIRIKSADEAAEIYGVPVLANIPDEKAANADLTRLAMTDRPGSPAAEAYRMLRNNLGFVNFDKGVKTLLVTSAVPSEGKSTVAANLAAVLAAAGSNVVLVVCDFYLPAAERFFDLNYTVGLSNLLADTMHLSAALQRPSGYENLTVITSGPLPPNPSELLGSEAMGALLGALRETVDWVILDSAPVLAAADTAAMTRWVDGVLVVARLGVTKREMARAGLANLRNVGARILGLAVWGPMDTATTTGYYGYHDPDKR